MKIINLISRFSLIVVLLLLTSCNSKLDELAQNRSFTETTDYTVSSDMNLPLLGAYATFYDAHWEDFPLISVRGDDVNAGGLGDQQDFSETDKYNYNKDYWMYNSTFQHFYSEILSFHSAMEQIELYKENGGDANLAKQYTSEIMTMNCFTLFQLSRVWGSLILPTSSDPSELLVAGLTSKDDIMQYISDQMDAAIPNLPDMRPNSRQDIPGGISKYTALAIKALANLELKNYQNVADATGQIIGSGLFSLNPDFYQLFKIPGKLDNENILELQYSDFGQGSGTNKSYLYAFFGPSDWTPAITGANGGWGFYEPSLKYIKFMLNRGETVRLETSVLFTPRGIAEIQKDPNYATLPSWVSNITRDGDQINDFAREMFVDGKHYLPSVQLTPGRTDYGTNNNFRVIRYAEILLMYAEALTQGANDQGMTADQAVNLVRSRAGMPPLTGVTNAQVMDEKFAELAMEWGTRYYDMVRLKNYSELSYDGRTFTEDKTFLPYPQAQVDKLPVLGN